MNTLASQSMKKIKVDGGAPSPAAKQSGGRGAGSGKAKGTSARKRKTSSEDDNEVPVTPTKKPESSKKAKKEDSAEVDDGIESEVLGANGGASGFEAYGINLGAYGVGTDLDYDF